MKHILLRITMTFLQLVLKHFYHFVSIYDRQMISLFYFLMSLFISIECMILHQNCLTLFRVEILFILYIASDSFAHFYYVGKDIKQKLLLNLGFMRSERIMISCNNTKCNSRRRTMRLQEVDLL